MMWIVLSFLFSNPTFAQSHLSCLSNRVLEVQVPQQRGSESFHLIISNQGRVLTYNYLSEESLIYNSITGQFMWNTRSLGNQMVAQDEYGQFATATRTPRGKIRFSPLPTPVSNLAHQISQTGTGKMQEQMNLCKNRLTFREQLRLPINQLEKDKCGKDLDILNGLVTCFETKSCPEAFKKFEQIATSKPQYSFTRLFESNTSPTDPEARVGRAMAADSVGSWGAAGWAVANKKLLTKVAAKIGMSYGTIFGAINVGVSLTKPIIFLVTDFDKCGDSGKINKNSGRTLEDCVGYNGVNIKNKFIFDYVDSVADPANFKKTFFSKSNGLSTRLLCYSFEEELSQWWQYYQDMKKFSCQGRTLESKNGKIYYIADNGRLYRHESIDQSYHFTLGVKTEREDRNSGARSSLEDIVRKGHSPPQQIFKEQTVFAAIAGQIKQLGAAPNCHISPSSEANSEASH